MIAFSTRDLFSFTPIVISLSYFLVYFTIVGMSVASFLVVSTITSLVVGFDLGPRGFRVFVS